MSRPSWDTLNAYVDGELDSSAAAEVAQAAGDDPAVAEQIATLYQLKGSCLGVAPDLPAFPGHLLDKRPHQWRKAVAAVAAALLLGAALWLAFAMDREPARPENALATARTLHAQWLEAESVEAQQAQPVALLAALSDFGRLPVVPDLASTALTVSTVKVAGGPGGRILQIGYRGIHGCHLSLFVFANDELPNSRLRLDEGLDRAYGWRVGDLGYLLFARGMDESRFWLIAEKVEEATHAKAPLNREAREALAENKRNSASCKA
jgi:hypothetical protein